MRAESEYVLQILRRKLAVDIGRPIDLDHGDPPRPRLARWRLTPWCERRQCNVFTATCLPCIMHAGSGAEATTIGARSPRRSVCWPGVMASTCKARNPGLFPR